MSISRPRRCPQGSSLKSDLDPGAAATTEGIPVAPSREDPSHVIGILTGSDLLSAHGQRLAED